MQADFEYTCDEIQLEVAEGVYTTISGDFRAFATVTHDQYWPDEIDVYRVDAQCGAEYTRDAEGNLNRGPDNWQRIDDVPAFAAIVEAVKKQADHYAPENEIAVNTLDELRADYRASVL